MEPRRGRVSLPRNPPDPGRRDGGGRIRHHESLARIKFRRHVIAEQDAHHPAHTEENRTDGEGYEEEQRQQAHATADLFEEIPWKVRDS